MPTHDVAVAHLTCGEVCLLNRRQLAYGPIEDALSTDTFHALYALGHDHHHDDDHGHGDGHAHAHDLLS